MTRISTGSIQDKDNPLQTPPYEVCERGIEAIRDYYRQLREVGTEKLYEAKLLIVGEAGAGKTTLAQKIKDANYQLADEASTEGIDVLHWQFDCPDGTPFRVNIWDFGGQEIYHATHQFFLTKRSLYAIVADNRKENDNLYYWLSIVELLAGKSPVLLVLNEKGNRKRDINEGQLRGRFLQLKATLPTNLASNRGLEDILTQIRHYISHLPHVGDELPATWVRVRKALEENPRNTMSLEAYLQLCEENGFTRRKDKLQLSGYLHDLGVCLHFQDDPLLEKTVILKPTWATDAVYKVLDNPTVTQNLGCFSRDDLAQIWSDDSYEGLQGELLQLMMRFQLCYELPNQPKHFIATQLLSANQPNYDWDETANLILRYKYDFMPKGILTRFIVAFHPDIANDSQNEQVVWRTGVVLEKDGAWAEVVEFYEQRELKIRVVGRNRRDLLTVVLHELDKIHGSFHHLKYDKLIPCNCDRCRNTQTPYFYKFEELKERLAHNKLNVECGKPPYRDVSVRQLIDDVMVREVIPDEKAFLRGEFAEAEMGGYRLREPSLQPLRTSPIFTPQPTPVQPAMSPEPSQSPEPKPTLMESFNNLPPSAKWGAVAVLALVAAGVITVPSWLNPSDNAETPFTETADTAQPETAPDIDLEIYVYTAEENEPLPGVDVRFLAPGGAIGDRTNSDGFVKLTVPQSEDIEIELRKDGFKPIDKQVNLVIDPERRRPYYMEPQS
ncbi:COR domain-containing protein [Geitlerinema sp. CS-897]|nr:COR domain-containing protein [Geitlerinema sp. CS-897]